MFLYEINKCVTLKTNWTVAEKEVCCYGLAAFNFSRQNPFTTKSPKNLKNLFPLKDRVSTF